MNVRFLAIPAALAGAACSPQLHVPPGDSGDVPVTLVNDTSATMCQVKLHPDGENIVKGAGFAAHKTATIKVKPGSYDVFVTGAGCGEPLTGSQRISVQQATEIHFGGTATAARPGVTLAVIPVSSTVGGQCVPDGQPAVNGYGTCCSGHVTSGRAQLDCCSPGQPDCS